jgi:hypothetical protein
MTKIRKIYQINRTGELTQTFDSIIECAGHHNVTRAYIYRLIKNQTKIKNRYYLSFTFKNRLAKFADDGLVMKTVEIIDRMSRYRDNLIIHQDQYEMVLKSKDKVRITKEIARVTRYLKGF